jgi:hypothetical protein
MAGKQTKSVMGIENFVRGAHKRDESSSNVSRRREALDQRIESSIGYELRTDIYMETQ